MTMPGGASLARAAQEELENELGSTLDEPGYVGREID